MKTILNNSRRHDITFNADGRIEISARATRALDLHPGEVIDVAIDEHNREAYLYVKYKNPVGRHKSQCYRTGRGRTCNSLRAHSIEICRQVLDLCGFSCTQVKLPAGDPIAVEGINKALPIIIRYKC